MKKSLIAVLILVLVVALEALALYFKAKNPEPTVFALDTQEYALPVRPIKVSPLPFETDFVEVADKALSDVQFVIENSFARKLSQSVLQMVSQQEMEALRKSEQRRKLDEFRQTMAAESTEIRGVYLGNNMCEIDGIKGLCANGVYTLGEHCIACFDGVCAGAKCAKKPKAEVEVAATEDTKAENAEEEPTVVENAVVENVENSSGEKVEEQPDLHDILQNAEAASQAERVAAETQAEVAADAEAAINNPQPEEAEVVATKEEVAEVKPVEAEPKAKEEPKVEVEQKVEAKAENAAVPAEEKAVNKADESKKVQVAVVIDDLGLSVPFTNQMAEIKYPITVSFLPYGMSNKKQVMQLKNAGMEVMLHVPMMPRVPADLAPVTLSPKMSKAEIQEKLLTMMERFSDTGMQGINNHMGSAFTESREAMSAVMEILKGKKMFFLDSMTTGKSVGRSVSREYGVPFVARDVFLDNERNYNYIMGQFRETERVARKKGYAIAIGHPYPQTLQALRDWLKQTEEKNIEVVPLSFLVNKLN